MLARGPRSGLGGSSVERLTTCWFARVNIDRHLRLEFIRILHLSDCVHLPATAQSAKRPWGPSAPNSIALLAPPVVLRLGELVTERTSRVCLVSLITITSIARYCWNVLSLRPTRGSILLAGECHCRPVTLASGQGPRTSAAQRCICLCVDETL